MVKPPCCSARRPPPSVPATPCRGPGVSTCSPTLVSCMLLILAVVTREQWSHVVLVCFSLVISELTHFHAAVDHGRVFSQKLFTTLSHVRIRVLFPLAPCSSLSALESSLLLVTRSAGALPPLWACVCASAVKVLSFTRSQFIFVSVTCALGVIAGQSLPRLES